MKNFVQLYEKLSQTKEPLLISGLIVEYFNKLNRIEEKNASLKLLLGLTPKKIITTKQLKIEAGLLTGYPDWLVERSESETGSFISALALLLRSKNNSPDISLEEWMKMITKIPDSQETDIHEFIIQQVSKADPGERKILLQILTGTFKSSVHQNLVQNALAKILNISQAVASLRLHELASNNQVSYQNLDEALEKEEEKIPATFPQIDLMDGSLENLGDPGDWKAFGKRDGIEAQLVKYGDSVHLWSSEFEIISEKFPEIIGAAHAYSGNIKISGQIIPQNRATTSNHLKSRFGKKTITKNEISSFPATFEIWRILAPNQQAITEQLVSPQFSSISPINFSIWTELLEKHKNCRKDGFTGILLHHLIRPQKYLFRKAASFAVNAVLTYLELGGLSESGIKSMTFGILNKEEIVPIGKVDAPFVHIDVNEIAAFARENTMERFGPVRTIKPEIAFELHFDGVAPAPRRKSGFMLDNLSVHQKLSGGLSFVDSLVKIQKLM